ncbi:MBL fold hydrolase [Amycolatopsis deserti]|uniref:MBL fold hydrolase n=1 Tax=Amycolatopsis deserti TaxID=185696 RepID=A0ABQ3IGN7_9PSEU|nr:N-acyl homoserine lactonase family protein [Amycolatopsis deserti]GHE80625.1 MBL fold hydrolase [Amycolatopsis deserti]
MHSGQQSPDVADDRYEILVVRHGELNTRRSHVFLNYEDYGEPDGPFTLGYYFWVVRNQSRTVVFDTGFSREAAIRRGRTVLLEPPEALRQLGVEPAADVTVVLSHGHYDHAGNLDYFENAPVLMARAEFEFWRGPGARHHHFASLAEPAELGHLDVLEKSGRLRLTDGEVVVAPGITLAELPGHTPGQVVLLVDTPAGRVLLASDAVHFDEELDRDMPFRHMCDLVDAYGSLDRLRDLRDSGEVCAVIAGHETRVMERYPPLPGTLGEHVVVIGAGE